MAKPIPKQETLKTLRAEIVAAKAKLRAPNTFSPQVIAYTLKHIAEEYGKVEANKAIVDLGLEAHGWKTEN